MHCSVCYLYLDPSQAPVLPCSCTNCSDCLTQWILTQSKELHFQTYEKIPCMNSGCRKPFKVNDITSQLTLDQQEKINSAIFSVYLKKTPDIRMCPNSDCQYAGYIDTSSTCSSNLECAACQTQWREKIHLTTKEKVREFFSENNSKRSEALCDLWEEMFARRCPGCNVNIQKSGGCDHMTCGKCQYEFCWHCTQKHQGHNKIFCLMAAIIKLMILALPVVNILWMVGAVQIVFSFIGFVILFLIKCLICNGIIFVGYFFTKLYHKKQKRERVLTAMLGVMLVIITWYFDLYFDMVKAAGVEAMVLGGICIYDNWLHKWFLNVY